EWEEQLLKLLKVKELAVIIKNKRIILVVVDEAKTADECWQVVNEFNKSKPFDTQISDIELRSVPLPRTATGKIKRWAI
ncbi:MAG: hypothetical protein RSB03_06785, partial [Oscillospiraceae bacterium]